MSKNNLKLKCVNCKSSEFYTQDGLYFCEECNVQHENLVEMEYAEFDENLKTKQSIYIGKQRENEQNKLNNERLTSFEEYNLILIGLVDQILEFKRIPNFKVTCLQLWMAYLQQSETAFFDKDHKVEPKLFAYYRQSDAEILYNRKPTKKVKKRKRKKEPKNDSNDNADVHSKNKQLRKSEKIISQSLSESMKSSSLNSSILANMSIQSIISEHEQAENYIKFSKIAAQPKLRKKSEYVLNLRKKVKEEDDDTDKRVLYRALNRNDRLQILNGNTILCIIYCALNICRSDITLSDLIRFVREGHLSYYNFHPFLPENLIEHGVKLSFHQFQSCHIIYYEHIRDHIKYFTRIIPDLRESIRMPDITELSLRYVDELNLPNDFKKYIERLIMFSQPKMEFETTHIPNYESRAMAFIIFLLKLLFGIDGYREKEISNAALKINKKLQQKECQKSLFVYESWREFIEYRQVVLEKFYHPTLLSRGSRNEKPYEDYNAMLQSLNIQSKHTESTAISSKMDLNRRKPKMNAQEIIANLIKNRKSFDPKGKIQFPMSLTPFQDNIKQILSNDIECDFDVNKEVITLDFSLNSCDFYLKPEALLEIMKEYSINLNIKKATFPKSFIFFKHKIRNFPASDRNTRILEFDNGSIDKWRKSFKERKRNEEEENIEKSQKYHTKRLNEVLRDRSFLKETTTANKLTDDKVKSHILDILVASSSSESEDDSPDNDEIIFNKEKSFNSSEMDLSFVVPDFNMWEHIIPVQECCGGLDKAYGKHMEKLPESFLWLLNHCANYIQHHPMSLYTQVLCVESHFMKIFSCDETSISVKKFLVKTFPIFSWLITYKKDKFIGDFISGISVAMFHLPGMGHALLANLPPVVGIYMAFFPVLIYTIFGSSRHNSMGTFAVLAIMIEKCVNQHSRPIERDLFVNGTSENDFNDSFEHDYTPLEVATLVTFIVGCIQLIMYCLRLGILSFLLSASLVSGLTCGAAFHILTAQVKDLIGVRIPPVGATFKIIKTYIEIFRSIDNVNYVTFVISITTILIMMFNNEYLKPRVARKTKFPIPMELLVILCGTLISTFFELEKNFEVIPVGFIPNGLPAPIIPKFGIWKELLVDSFAIAVVSYSVSVSMAIMFSQKMNYEVDFNQELLAMGSANIMGSFFSCFPISAALARSLIQQSLGGKTQLASLVSCLTILCVLLWIGSFFTVLPRSILAAVICVALKGLLMKIGDFFRFQKKSKLDGFVWAATFLTVVIVAIDIGLLVGIVLNLLTLIYTSLKPDVCILGKTFNGEYFLDVDKFENVHEIPKTKIFHYGGAINFATKSFFRTLLCNRLEINLNRELKLLGKNNNSDMKTFNHLILNFSALTYIDSVSITALSTLISDFNKLNVKGQNQSSGSGGDKKDDKDKKKKYEPPIPTRVGKKKRKQKGPDAALKLPQVTPHTRCRLKLLKLERIKDYLLMEEEFIRNQERLKPQEEKNEEERSKVDDLRGTPMSVGNLEEIIDDNHAIVSTSVGSEHYVSILSFVDKDQLEPGCSVLLNHKVHAVVGVLGDDTDPMVTVMKLEKAPQETYADIGGLDTQIQEIKESVELPLTHPEYYEEMGIKPPKGVILYGAPGTGKTLLAKAVANQTSATFLRVVGSELIQKYLGDGPKLVRELFRVAEEHAPSIVFIDEIDAVGTKRYDSNSGGEREIQRTMLELLNQLDGFDSRGDVKVIMATNRIETLDPALIRPGRIDRKIEFPLPDEKTKRRIFNIHTSKMTLSTDVNLSELIMAKDDLSGADIKAICTEAGLMALRERRMKVTNEDFKKSKESVLYRKKEGTPEGLYLILVEKRKFKMSEEAVNECTTQMIALAKTKASGISNDDIKSNLVHINPEVRLMALNKLIQQEILEILKKGETLIYRLKDPAKKSSAPSDMDNEERIIYNIIEEGANTGIWIRDIRVKSNLIMTQLNKILKNLENRKLIKAVKSVNASKKKVYMLYNLEPDRSVTGGAWYQDSDFEAEFVDVLNQQCLRFLQMKRENAKKQSGGPIAVEMKMLCTVSEVHKFISELGISKIKLDEEDLETILKTVVYDGKAQRVLQVDGSYLYKAVESLLPPVGLVQSPCGICPVIKNCSDVGSITPKTCAYMTEWLE
ncbi:CLUMA_CG002257, isoform A [Clunio marinus]|uniref:CLUMA_CG002257, isoform A n=2 Tax=Bilateria TaxID=33213 RepID=A0A1J1HPP4_9DIPT|nr:CLUMA_CG002257, isoform A [Clunio marinus]